MGSAIRLEGRRALRSAQARVLLLHAPWAPAPGQAAFPKPGPPSDNALGTGSVAGRQTRRHRIRQPFPSQGRLLTMPWARDLSLGGKPAATG
jgi:hypothetical protein